MSFDPACSGAAAQRACVRATRPVRAVACAALLAGCSAFSPQVLDTHPTYGLSIRGSAPAASAALGGCGPAGAESACPALYGRLPAAVDAVDEMRLQYLRAFVDESGMPRALEWALVPTAAYAIYRGLFGSGDAAQRDVARATLGGAGAYVLARDAVSPERQRIRLAAADALGCAIRGSVARYLYEADRITGATDRRDGAETERIDPPAGLLPAIAYATHVEAALRSDLAHLEVLRDAAASQLVGSGRHGNACDEQPGSPICRRRGETGPTRTAIENPTRRVLEQAVQRGKDALGRSQELLGAAEGLRERIDDAPLALVEAARRIAAAAAEATLATEPGIEAIRRSVAGLRVAAQDFGLPGTATAPAGAGTPTFVAQSGRVPVETQPAPVAAPEAVAAAATSAQLRARLESASAALERHLAADRERAALAASLGDCRFTEPGVKLAIAPPARALEVTAGQTLTLVAEGGNSLPTVVVAGATDLAVGNAISTDADATPGRQRLRVTIKPPTTAAGQRLTLVFRNGELADTREVLVLPATKGPP